LIDLLNFTELLYRSLIIIGKWVSSYKLYVKNQTGGVLYTLNLVMFHAVIIRATTVSWIVQDRIISQ